MADENKIYDSIIEFFTFNPTSSSNWFNWNACRRTIKDFDIVRISKKNTEFNCFAVGLVTKATTPLSERLAKHGITQ